MEARKALHFLLRSDLSAEELRSIQHRLLDMQVALMDKHDALQAQELAARAGFDPASAPRLCTVADLGKTSKPAAAAAATIGTGSLRVADTRQKLANLLQSELSDDEQESEGAGSAAAAAAAAASGDGRASGGGSGSTPMDTGNNDGS